MRGHRAWVESGVRAALRGLVPEGAGLWAWLRRRFLRRLADLASAGAIDAGEALAVASQVPSISGVPDEGSMRRGMLAVDPAWDAELADVVAALVDLVLAGERRGHVRAAADERARIVARMREARISERTIERLTMPRSDPVLPNW